MSVAGMYQRHAKGSDPYNLEILLTVSMKFLFLVWEPSRTERTSPRTLDAEILDISVRRSARPNLSVFCSRVDFARS